MMLGMILGADQEAGALQEPYEDVLRPLVPKAVEVGSKETERADHAAD